MTYAPTPGSPWEADVDAVSQVLQYYDISPGEIDGVRDVLISYLVSRDPEVPMYLVPQADAAVLTGPQLAGEIVDRSELGDSFVELFVAGVLMRNPLALAETVESLQQFTKEQ